MADKPTLTNIESGRLNPATVDGNFDTLRDNCENLLGRGGVDETSNYMTGDLDMNRQRIRNVANAEASGDAVSLAYLNSILAQGASAEGIVVVTEDFTATAGQTLFTLTVASYTQSVGQLQVYTKEASATENGYRRLNTDEYTETSTSSFTLSDAANVGDKVLAIIGQPVATTAPEVAANADRAEAARDAAELAEDGAEAAQTAAEAAAASMFSVYQTFTGDGALVEFTLSYEADPVAENVFVVIDGVVQAKANYTIEQDGSGDYKILTFTTAPPLDSLVMVWSSDPTSNPDIDNLYQQVKLEIESDRDDAIAAVSAQETSSIAAVAAEGTTQIGLVGDAGDAELVDIAAAGDAELVDIAAAGDAEIVDVEAAGTTQVAAVNSAGTTQVGLVEDEGDEQVARVEDEGDTQVARIQTPGVELVREIGGTAYESILDFPCAPSLDWKAFDYIGETNNVPSNATFSRASTAYFTNQIGNLEAEASGDARINFSANGGTEGWLLEEQRTNLVTYSEELDNSAWGKTVDVTVTANDAVAPDGNTTADKCEQTAASSFQNMFQTVTVVDATQYTASIYLHAGTAASCRLRIISGATDVGITNIDPTDGTGDSGYQAEDIGDGWFRYDITFTSNGTSATFYFYPANSDTATGYTYAFGAQLEAGGFPTSYIKTTSAAATRLSDSLTAANSAYSYNPNEGTFYIEFEYEDVNPTFYNHIFEVYTDSNNRFGVYLQPDNTIWVLQKTSGTININTQIGSVSPNTRHKLAFTYGGYAWCLDGGAVGTDADTNVPTTTTTGVGTGTSAKELSGVVGQFAYFPRALSSTQLQTLTS